MSMVEMKECLGEITELTDKYDGARKKMMKSISDSGLWKDDYHGWEKFPELLELG